MSCQIRMQSTVRWGHLLVTPEETYEYTWDLLEFLAGKFLLPCVSFSMLHISGGTGCEKVCILVHGCWDSKDVGVFDCVKDCMRFVMYLII